MEVYIEYVLIDNMVINLILLFLTKTLLKLNVKKSNMLLSAFVGTLFAFVMPFLTLGSMMLFFLKICIAVIILSFLKRYKSALEFFVTFFTFVTFTFLFGGIIFALLDLLNAKTSNSGLLIYNFEIPVGVIVFIIFIYAYFMMNLIQEFYKRKIVHNYIYDVVIKEGKTEVKAKGFLDSGNRLTDEDTQKPILIMNYAIFEKLHQNVKITDVILKKTENLPLKNVKLMKISGVNGKNNHMLVFELDEVKILLEEKEHIIKNVMAGLTFLKFKDSLEYNLLLNPLLMEEGERYVSGK